MDAKTFLFVSKDGLIGDIAWRVARKGHDVTYAVTDNEFSGDVAQGFVTRTDEWRPHVDDADVIVFDDAFGLGRHAEELRADGHAVIGGTAFTDRLEEDRGLARRTMEDAGMDTIPSRTFTDFAEAIAYVEANPDRYVIKPNGEVQNFKQLLYLGEEPDGSDIVHRLERYRDRRGDEMESFQLQRRVDGIEVAICGFFNGEKFVEPVNFNFEHKRFFTGDLGPMTPEMGTHMFWQEKNRLFEETLGRLTDVLRAEDYRGSFDLNVIVDEDGIRPLEFTPRFGYPTIFIQEEGIRSGIDAFLHDLANGDDPDLDVHDGFQTGMRVVVPPYPYDDDDTFDELSSEQAVRFDFDDPAANGIHIEDVKRVDGEWRVAGATGEALVVTGTGETLREAQREMYDRAARVRLPTKYYRTDIGDRWLHEGEKLVDWGYIDPI